MKTPPIQLLPFRDTSDRIVRSLNRPSVIERYAGVRVRSNRDRREQADVPCGRLGDKPASSTWTRSGPLMYPLMDRSARRQVGEGVLGQVAYRRRGESRDTAAWPGHRIVGTAHDGTAFDGTVGAEEFQ